MAKKYFCPNCGEQAELDGNDLICEACDIRIGLVKKEPRVKEAGRFKKLEQRVATLEVLIGKDEDRDQKSIKNNDDDDNGDDENGNEDIL